MPKKAKQHFHQLLKECEWLKGCVAFWTIYPSFFNGKLLDVLSRKESFYCIHLSSPTNFDALDEFHHNGANLFAYNYFWKSLLEEGHHPPLLHAKVALFGLPNNRAVIWIGSHNFTQSALLDINIEASTVVETTIGSDYYNQTLNFLNGVKKKCDTYSPFTSKWLKILRGKKLELFTHKEIAELYSLEENLINHFFKTQVISFVGENISELHTANSLIQVIGLDKQFYRTFSIKQKEVLLLLRQPNDTIGYFYLATVVLTGDIVQAVSDSYNMEFSLRRYAVLEKNVLGAILKKKTAIKKEQLQQAEYVASLNVEKCIGQVKIFPYPEAAWKTVDAEELQGVLNWQEKEDLFKKEKSSKTEEKQYISSMRHREVKFKKLDDSVATLTKEESIDTKSIEEKELTSLTQYYKKRLAILEQQQELTLSDGVKKEKKPILNPPKFAECDQSNYGKIVVVMEETQIS